MESREPNLELLNSTPTIPNSIYKSLPILLQKQLEVFKAGRERDVVLMSSLGVLSGLVDSVHGIYGNKKVFSNLFIFIGAPAASQKGAMIWSKKIGEELHKEYLNQFEVEKKEYELKLLQHKGKNSTEQSGLYPPQRKLLYLPANSSSASIIQTLYQNNGTGIIFESEADTLSATLKNDWGNYSDMLRKGFHHETISSNRKTNCEYYEVEFPKLSLVLSGTPAQIQRLIPSVEDGLFSRFCFYVYKVPPVWIDVSPSSTINMEQHFNAIKREFYHFQHFYRNREVRFNLQIHQWEILNNSFSKWLPEYALQISNETSSIIVRLGLMSFRIAMLLTLLRNYEKGNQSTYLESDDEDFYTALELATIIKDHAMTVFSILPRTEKEGGIKEKKQRKELLDQLPKQFDRKQAVEVGTTQLDLGERTVDKYLKELLQLKLLASNRYGNYEKQ